MKNIDLATKYNKVYKEGAYSNYFTFNFFPGERTIIDLEKRLKNALKDANMNNNNVEKLLDWLRKAMPYFQQDEFSGATIAYKISKNKS